jgi:hypothetical protein
MNAVLGSILENLRSIEIVDTPTVDPFKKDKTNTGDSKEITVKEFIERYLPSDFRVKKGIIYSQTSESNNIDCVILAPNHPALTTPVRSVILAEGVYAAVEVKPDITVLTDGGELLRGLKQIKSVKSLTREIEEIDLSRLLKTTKPPEYFKKIPAVIFSHRSTDIKDTIDFIISKIKDNTLGLEEIPDIIVTLDKGIIFYTPHLSATNFGQQLSKEQREIYKERVFIHFDTNEKEVILSLFLLMFLNFTPPTILTQKFIIKDYLSQLGLKFKTKIYPVEVDVAKALDHILNNLVAKTKKQD